jgi:hypothetical protein
MADQWHCNRQGKQVGPFTSEQLRQLAASGQLQAADLVWKEGMAGWVAASEVQGLFPAATARNIPAPPPPPPHQRASSTGGSANSPKSFMDRAKQAAATAANSAKAAAMLAAKQAERVKITQVTLPAAYLALGKEVYGAGRFCGDFGDVYTKANETFAKLQAIKRAPPAPPTESIADKAKAAAGHARDLAKSKALEIEAAGVLRQLGEGAYQRFGEQSGSVQLTQPITQCHARLRALELEIEQISASRSHGSSTPRLLLLAGGVVGALVVLMAIAAFSDKGGSARARTATSAPSYTDSPKEHDFSKLDYTKGPNGEPLTNRDGSDNGNDFTDQGFVTAGGRFLNHGRSVVWHSKPANGEPGKKKFEGYFYNGKKHGQWTGWYANGAVQIKSYYVDDQKQGKEENFWDTGNKAREAQYHNGQVEGLVRLWYENGKPRREETYLNGKLNGLMKMWWENGQQRVDAHFTKGVRDGDWTVWWTDSGSPKYSLHFENGHLARCAKAEFIAALNEVKNSSYGMCDPMRETFMAAMTAVEFFQVFGSPAAEAAIDTDNYDGQWVYRCTDGDLKMDVGPFRVLKRNTGVTLNVRRLGKDGRL